MTAITATVELELSTILEDVSAADLASEIPHHMLEDLATELAELVPDDHVQSLALEHCDPEFLAKEAYDKAGPDDRRRVLEHVGESVDSEELAHLMAAAPEADLLEAIDEVAPRHKLLQRILDDNSVAGQNVLRDWLCNNPDEVPEELRGATASPEEQENQKTQIASLEVQVTQLYRQLQGATNAVRILRSQLFELK